jgi:hypothetical protein
MCSKANLNAAIKSCGFFQSGLEMHLPAPMYQSPQGDCLFI